MEHGLTSESSSTSSDGCNNFQPNLPMSDDFACEPVLPAFPMPGDGALVPFNQPQVPFNQPQQNFGGSTSYHLPTSNLPQDYRLESSSRVPFPQMQQQFNSQYPWTNRQPQNQITMHDPLTAFGSQQVPTQAMAGPSMAPNSFYPNGVVPYQFQFHLLNSQTQQQDEMMTWNQGTSQDLNTYLQPPTDPRIIRNAVYDPMYQMMGLPVDPHLRIFVAKRNNGNQN